MPGSAIIFLMNVCRGWPRVRRRKRMMWNKESQEEETEGDESACVCDWEWEREREQRECERVRGGKTAESKSSFPAGFNLSAALQALQQPSAEPSDSRAERQVAIWGRGCGVGGGWPVSCKRVLTNSIVEFGGLGDACPFYRDRVPLKLRCRLTVAAHN